MQSTQEEIDIDRLVDEAFDRAERKKAQKLFPPADADVDEINPPVLRRILGDSPSARVLDFLCFLRNFRLLSYRNSQKFRSGMEDPALCLASARNIRHRNNDKRDRTAKINRLNPDSKIAKALNLLNLDIAFYDARMIVKEQESKQEVIRKNSFPLRCGTPFYFEYLLVTDLVKDEKETEEKIERLPELAW